MAQPLSEGLSSTLTLEQAILNVELESAEQLIEEESELLLRVELSYELVDYGPSGVHCLLVDGSLLREQLRKQEAHDDGQHIASGLLR